MTDGDGERIVECFREAAMGMIDWSVPLSALAQATRSRIAQLAAINAQGGLAFNYLTGCSTDEETAYLAAGGPNPLVNPRTRALMMASPLHCMVDSDFISPMGRQRTPIYNGLFHESDVPFAMLTRLDSPTDLVATLSLLQPGSVGEAEAADVRFVDAIAPAISAAIHAAIALGTTVDQSLVTTADHLSGAGILLGPDMSIAALSPGAEALLRDATHLSVRAGRLIAACPRTAASLEHAFAAMNAHGTEWRGAVPITLSGAMTSATPLFADMCPLPRRPSGPLSQARALLAIRMPRSDAALDDVRLMTAFTLTPSELEVARSLLRGDDLATIARRRRTSLATVRSQLRSLFVKTGCHRQAELVLTLRAYC
ncbi:helix-turn-helix transcriptional regulator [Sphingomonas mollis]|uniref:Helix-turn-helix transcriptional regulator n=1 Tax=Sphingomonas mollis TaxID=2795726 RepID=A0ABS0XPC8_9SPHN|nr:helix-turn-helix transcriptional regulator [Sphingomonas sp. BT553]MBJ6121900.1 helix-turn-helix transcriptional regulator [Sphingomonas sp. BT553]